ncbi:MAG: PAS domain-containing sensor histidine kinase [Chitinophagaceae bacterium]|nr:PAS domain-containing sensor histidine kinase [Chitinophagaceae bacterium]
MATLIHRINKPRQYLYSLLLLFIVAAGCYFSSPYINYRVVAFLLLLVVSVTAVLFDILPVLITAALSALTWNFFFIPPRFTFRIDNTEDMVLFLMYFVIALVNATLTFKIRKMQKESLAKEEKANTIKLYNTLLNSLSHELRTPIATIVGATDNLQNFNSKLSDFNRNELVHEISKASFRLNQQVENLLNMSRLESGFIQPKKDWCDMVELLYETVKRIEENTGIKKISIQVDQSIPLFKLDKGMMEQVIYNLLYNATLYTPQHAAISISAHCHADVLKIVVEDNGPGFPPEEIDNVFDKFYRLKNTQAGGTGLGLSIVKGFTEAHNGTIFLENADTGGARFTINIPAETSYLNNLKNE